MCETFTGNEGRSAEADTDDGPSISAPPDQIFEILSDSERRHALRSLGACQSPVALADLADRTACTKYDEPLTRIPAEDVKRVYMRLYHSHIPKFEEANLVEYDQETDTVRITEQFADLNVKELLSATHR